MRHDPAWLEHQIQQSLRLWSGAGLRRSPAKWSAPVTVKKGGKQLSSLTWAVALTTTASNDPNSIGDRRHTWLPARVLRQAKI